MTFSRPLRVRLRLARETGVGERAVFTLGGASETAGDRPVEAEFVVERLTDGEVVVTGPMYGGNTWHLGRVALLLVLGGIRVRPGDIIFGDDDGVVLVRPEEAETVAALSRAREEKEARIMKAVREGGDALSLLGTDKIIAAKGCTFE